MWLPDVRGWRLDPRENILKQWLPILSEQEYFYFGEEVEVQWMHEWPTDAEFGFRVLYFIRDPRDALYSRYRRERATLSFKEYLAFPDAFSLLDKIDHWIAFNEAWLAHPCIKVIRFEDYKADAFGVLKETVNWLGLTRSDADLRKAVEKSSFERAAEAERAYLRENGGGQLINRAGKAGEWCSLTEENEAIEEITRRCAFLLCQLGYEARRVAKRGIGNRPQFGFLNFFSSVRLPDSIRQTMEKEADLNVREFITRLNPQLLRASGVTDSEAHVMLDTLSEYARAAGWPEALAMLGKLYEAMGIARPGWWSRQRARLQGMLKRIATIGSGTKRLGDGA
jgi:hypothetical protein